VIIGVLAVVGIVPLVMSALPKPPTDIASQYLTEEVVTHDLTVTVTGNGQITDNDSRNPKAVVLISEYDIANVRLGQQVELTIGAFDEPVEGKVKSMSDNVDMSTGVRTYAVSINLDELPKRARVGMSATAEVVISTSSDVLAVPVNAVAVSDGVETVQVLRDDEIVTVQVETGSDAGSLVEITSGLSAGEIIITGINGSVPTTGESGGFLPPSPDGVAP
jgi:hypothetical protein